MLPFTKYHCTWAFRLGVHEVPAWEGQACFEIDDLPAADSVEQMQNVLPPLIQVSNYMTL